MNKSSALLAATLTLAAQGLQITSLSQEATTGAAMCVNTPGWLNGGNKHPCATYAKSWCDAGKARPGKEWALGAAYNFPEKNCCACGKATAVAGAGVGRVVYSYQGYDLQLNNPDAQKHCEEKKERLAEVWSEVEYEAAKQAVKSYQGKSDYAADSVNWQTTWVGLKTYDGKWTWDSGHKSGWSHWWAAHLYNRPNDHCAFSGNTNGWLPRVCGDKLMRVICEKRAPAPTADKCTAAAVGFEASIATAQGWKAYQDSIACKVKVAGESKATRDAAVKAYLSAIQGAKVVDANVAKCLADKTKAASNTVTAKTKLDAAQKVVTEGNAAVTTAQGVHNAATKAETTADNAYKAATDAKTKDDAKLVNLKAAAMTAHAHFTKGQKAVYDHVKL